MFRLLINLQYNLLFLSPLNDKYCYMKKEILQSAISSQAQNENTVSIPGSDSPMDRRKFVEVVASGALAFTIVPRHVLGGKSFVAPSDKITLAYIGTGTQGIRELLPLLTMQQ